MARDLDSVVGQFFFGEDYTPNAAKGRVVEVVDRSAALTALVVEMQTAGADVSRWSEDEWRKILSERFAVDEDEMGDYLEKLASWGIVDNNWYLEEGL